MCAGMIDDHLRVDVRKEEVEEAINDSFERDEGGGGMASRYSDERARFACRSLRC